MAAYTERISTGCTFTWNGALIGGLVDCGFDLTIPMQDSTRQVDPVTGAAPKYRDYIGGLPELDISVKLQWDRRDTDHAGIQTDHDNGQARTAILILDGGGAAEANMNPSFSGIIESISVPETLGDVVFGEIKIAVSDPSTLAPL